VLTGAGAAMNTANIARGDTVAVVGCGGVGLNVIQGARIAGARMIIAVDTVESKFAKARELGATHTVNATEGDPVEQVRALTDGYGANYAFECVGHPDVLAQVLACRDLAGVATLIGVPGQGSTLAVDLPRFFDLGGSLRVSWYGDCLPTRDFPLLTEWYLRGELLLDELITRRIVLAEVEDAFQAMERGETLRSVISF
jgi:S-(hydroxymethyl)mycothiol dehydrogenase